MGVFSRKNRKGLTWYAAYQVEGRQVQERVGSSRLAAERLLRQRQREVAGGVYQESAPTGAITLGAWLQRWLDARTCRSKRVSIWRAKRLLSRAWLTRRRVDELTPGDMARLVRELATEVAPNSVRGIWGTLSTCLRDAVIAGMIQSNPCLLPRGVIPSPARTSREPYETHEIQALLNDPRVEPHMRIVFALAFYAGVRRGEAVGFVWGDLQQAKPLRALHLERQWDGGPLKTAKRPGEAGGELLDLAVVSRHEGDDPSVGRVLVHRRPTAPPLRSLIQHVFCGAPGTIRTYDQRIRNGPRVAVFAALRWQTGPRWDGTLGVGSLPPLSNLRGLLNSWPLEWQKPRELEGGSYSLCQGPPRPSREIAAFLPSTRSAFLA